MVYTLEKKLFVPVAADAAWAFISNPANLNKITPDDMDFEIVTELPETMTEGMLVEYRVRIPLVGRQAWVSELKHIVEGRSFVDEQKVGPYAFWYHYHGIEPSDGGVELIDRVCYAPPFGLLGRLAHRLFIRRTLERIFTFREKAFADVLNQTH
jgi:ligand-binding SRPBCC domain-containing protein